MSQIRTLEALEGYLDLTADEKAWREDSSTVPLAITEHYMSLIDKEDSSDPLRRQVVPSSVENHSAVWEDMDPLAEEAHSVNHRLVHRYRNRVAFLVTDICPMYCRHCFRRRFTGTMQGPASLREIEESAGYVASHCEVKEILLTGGDVLTLSDSSLSNLISIFRKARPDLIIRLCTRYPVSDPKRIDNELIRVLKSFDSAPIYVMTQFNHPRELCDESKIAISRFLSAGFSVFNQSVLLRNVNDDPEVLAKLFEGLLAVGVKPYYLFQGDLVSGTSDFRVPLEKGIEIFRQLSELVSGLALPVYAIDLPNGGGKVTIGTGDLSKDPSGEFWQIRTPDGKCVKYPAI